MRGGGAFVDDNIVKIQSHQCKTYTYLYLTKEESGTEGEKKKNLSGICRSKRRVLVILFHLSSDSGFYR